jgi:membrane-bound lytic murein transglycosylase D
MHRASPYLEFIRREITELNLPPELLYLPIIESEFIASAVSRSGATGLWQFMTNSIAPFDMVVTDWIDERRDFWKSTKGALLKLEENYRFFRDWPLALAAYNAGLGAISRVTQNSGIRDYWILSERRLIPTETIHYVPKLLAAAYVLSDPRQHGLLFWHEYPDWVRVPVNRTVDLYLLADESGVHVDELKKANRELIHYITPPDHNYFLKVKAEDTEKVAAALERGLPLIRYYRHTIRSGDTLSALALQYGITVDQITALNPGLQARYLRIGATLMIPAFREVRTPQANSQRNLVFSENYVVKRGDSLWSISQIYGISPEALAEANNMRLNDILREGRVLKTPIRE